MCAIYQHFGGQWIKGSVTSHLKLLKANGIWMEKIWDEAVKKDVKMWINGIAPAFIYLKP